MRRCDAPLSLKRRCVWFYVALESDYSHWSDLTCTTEIRLPRCSARATFNCPLLDDVTLYLSDIARPTIGRNFRFSTRSVEKKAHLCNWRFCRRYSTLQLHTTEPCSFTIFDTWKMVKLFVDILCRSYAFLRNV